MNLEFIGIDPESKTGDSPTVWVNEEAEEIVIQGWKADAPLEEVISAKSWADDHTAGIPGHEAVVRIPARMVPILRKACDAAERSGLG